MRLFPPDRTGLNPVLFLRLILCALAVSCLTQTADAQTSTKKKVKTREIQPHKGRANDYERDRGRSKARRTHRDYAHVRVLHPRRHHDGRLDTQPLITRCARVSPSVLDRFEARQRDHLRRIMSEFRQGRRDDAVRQWGSFVAGLADYPEEVYLDDVMLLLAREGCGETGKEFRLRAARLDFTQEVLGRTSEYLYFLERQRDDCKRHEGLCPFDMMKNLETQIIRARADRDVFVVEERLAEHRFNEVLQASKDYERRFATTFDALFHEAEIRIRITP